MLAKKLLPGIIALLLALTPTYFIIYNSVNATGLPDFTAVNKILIKEPAVPGNQNRQQITLYSSRSADRDGLLLLSNILANLTPISSVSDSILSGACYEIVFTSKNDVETACYLYDGETDSSLYLRTSSGKVFLLTQPSAYCNHVKLEKMFFRYAVRRKENDSLFEDKVYRTSNPVALEIDGIDALSSLSFQTEPSQIKIHAEKDGEVLLDYVTKEEAVATTLPSGAFVTVNVEWELSEGFYYRAAYAFTVK